VKELIDEGKVKHSGSPKPRAQRFAARTASSRDRAPERISRCGGEPRDRDVCRRSKSWESASSVQPLREGFLTESSTRTTTFDSSTSEQPAALHAREFGRRSDVRRCGAQDRGGEEATPAQIALASMASGPEDRGSFRSQARRSCTGWRRNRRRGPCADSDDLREIDDAASQSPCTAPGTPTFAENVRSLMTETESARLRLGSFYVIVGRPAGRSSVCNSSYHPDRRQARPARAGALSAFGTPTVCTWPAPCWCPRS